MDNKVSLNFPVTGAILTGPAVTTLTKLSSGDNSPNPPQINSGASSALAADAVRQY